MKCAYAQQQNAVCANKQGEPLSLPPGAQVSCQQCCRQHSPQSGPLPQVPNTLHAVDSLQPHFWTGFMSHSTALTESTTQRQFPRPTLQARQEAFRTAAAWSLPDTQHRLTAYENQRRKLFETAEQQAPQTNVNCGTDNNSRAAWVSAWDELKKTLQKQ